AREKFLSLRKGTKLDITLVIKEELHNARSTLEQARFNLVTALSNVEAKKRMQEYRRQIDLEICWSSEGQHVFPNGDGIHTIGRGSHKLIEAVMQSAAKGKVQTIRQGYLLKRSSNLRGDWKRRFFFLDSRGMLYYYRKEKSKPSGRGSHLADQRNSSKMSPGLLSRWLSSRYHGGVHDKKSVAHHRVNLLTSTIKVDADQSDLRFEKLHFAGMSLSFSSMLSMVVTLWPGGWLIAVVLKVKSDKLIGFVTARVVLAKESENTPRKLHKHSSVHIFELPKAQTTFFNSFPNAIPRNWDSFPLG
ncbi:hypothetical protein GIB67_011829, partial [Kingdonia uniflora]